MTTRKTRRQYRWIYDNCPHKYITADERKEVAEAVATRNTMLVASGNIRASEDIVHIKSVLRVRAMRSVREDMSEHQHEISGKSRVVPSAERNGLLMRSVKSAFALLLTKVTKPTVCSFHSQ